MTATTTSTASERHGLLTEDVRWVRDRPRWVAELSDGLTVYMDDGRTAITPYQAWSRLRNYCGETGCFPVGMRLQFRSNVVWMPGDAAGYFFCKTAFGVYGQDRTYDGFVAGVLVGGTVYTRRYTTPELTPLDLGERPADLSSPCLIARPINLVDIPGGASLE